MLFNMSIRENIRIGKEGNRRTRSRQAARKAKIHRDIMRPSAEYVPPSDEGAAIQLSGGQRQASRFLARARSSANPSIYCSKKRPRRLDQTTEAAITRTLHESRENRTRSGRLTG